MTVAIADALGLADISDVMGTVSYEFGVGQVAQFSFPAVDTDGKIAGRGLLRAGTVLRWDNTRWEIAAVEREYRGESTWLTVECRSAVARRMRLMTGLDKATDVTPGQWISKYVRACGGTATVETGAKRRTINPKRTDSVLDVVASLASETSVEWVEIGGHVYVGTAWWALQGKTGLPTYRVAVDPATLAGLGSAPLLGSSLTTRESLDDRTQAAEASLTLERTLGQFLRPWNLVDLVDVPDPDRGLWLVTSVSFDDTAADVSVSLQRPRKSSPKNGSSGRGSLEAGSPVAGSSYSDVPVPAGWGGRSVANILALHRDNPGGLGHPIYKGCLWYAQAAAGYPHIGANPEALWPALAPGKKRASREIVPGAVVLYSNSNIGHAVVYVGGGRCLGTDMDSSGRFVPGKWSIAPIDAMERSFGVSLLGWYAP